MTDSASYRYDFLGIADDQTAVREGLGMRLALEADYQK